MTLEEMASAIRSNVGAGLKEVGNFTYSIDQIKDDISNTRSAIILEGSVTDTLNHQYFAQNRENLKLDPAVFPLEGAIESNSPSLVAKIPKVAMTKDNSSILYLGPVDMSLNIKTYFSLNDVKNHKYTRLLKNRPYSYIDLSQDEDGDIPVYIFNTGPSPFRYITVRAIFDDPVRILQEDGYYLDNEEFPAPLAVQKMIIQQLVQEYLIYYKQYLRSNESNDQTDKS